MGSKESHVVWVSVDRPTQEEYTRLSNRLDAVAEDLEFIDSFVVADESVNPMSRDEVIDLFETRLMEVRDE